VVVVGGGGGEGRRGGRGRAGVLLGVLTADYLHRHHLSFVLGILVSAAASD